MHVLPFDSVSMSKGAKSHTYHTNLFITYDVLAPIFVCGFKTEVLKST